jgi:drug/metabolite transporter (DMT)-like permease
MSVGETERMQRSSFFTERSVGVICGIGVILLFSGFTLISRLGFSSALTLPDIAALRFGIGGMALLPFVLRHGLSGLSWPQAAILAFLGGLGFALFAYTGFLLAPAAHGAVLLHGTLPLWTFLITTLVIGDRSARTKTPGILLIFAGVMLMAADSWLVATPRQLLGDSSLLLASLCWSRWPRPGALLGGRRGAVDDLLPAGLCVAARQGAAAGRLARARAAGAVPGPSDRGAVDLHLHQGGVRARRGGDRAFHGGGALRHDARGNPAAVGNSRHRRRSPES